MLLELDDALAAGEPLVNLVPMSNLAFIDLPAENDVPAFKPCVEMNDALVDVAERAAAALNLFNGVVEFIFEPLQLGIEELDIENRATVGHETASDGDTLIPFELVFQFLHTADERREDRQKTFR